MIPLIFALGYYLLFILLTFGLLRTRKIQNGTTKLKVSVVICARNEEHRITPLLQSIDKINYPIEKYEVILVDDQSTDKTAEIIHGFVNRHKNWQYFFYNKTADSFKGKKGALDFGIQKSQYEIILTTDADCIVPPDWLNAMLACFDEKTAVVQGYSPVIKRPDFLSLYQQFDTLAEGVTAASSMYFNSPSHANARNFAFRKSVYNEVGGFKEISHVDTGDDFFLAKLINKQTSYKFRYNPNEKAFVYTDEVHRYRDYLHQQLRRNSKAFDLSWQFLLMGIWLIIFHGIVLYLLISGQYAFSILFIIGKFVVEFLAVLAGVLKFNEYRILPWFPIFWIIYPLAYFLSQVLGSLRIYKWK